MIKYKWLEAFSSGGRMGFYSYFAVKQLEETPTGELKILHSPPIYIIKNPQLILAHQVFSAAENEVFLYLKRKQK